LQQETSAQLVSISGNMCVDKKPNALNFIEGRGISVWAEAEIPAEIVASILKTDIKSMVMVAEKKLYLGSILAHTIGANAHMANVLAALFLATGQDIAHVAECATGITTVEEKNNKLCISIYLPDLVIGTVGGGTNLATQKEALSILGISGGDHGKNAERLAEIIGGAVLAGELSLLASLAENTLAKAHATLGRGL
jgi:hydroxymethylglutaryl-CoA reductase (NADPH)